MEPFIGQICCFGFNYAPVGWALCNGQLLSIAQNTALFSLLGTTYGGDGQTTFALPNLQGRMPMHFGTGPGLSTRVMGELSGSEQTTLLINNLPAHFHTIGNANIPVTGTISVNAALNVSSNQATANIPAAQSSLGKSIDQAGNDTPFIYNTDAAPAVPLRGLAVSATPNLQANLTAGNTGNTGSSTPISNMPPFLVFNFCIALEGIFPSRP